MLIHNIQGTVKQLKQLNVLETAIQDAEKKVKNDIDYSELVSGFCLSLKRLSYANKELNFSPTVESIQLAVDIIDQLESTTSSGAVDAEVLTSAKQKINRKFTPGLSKEWKAFHQTETSSVITKMNTIGSLAQDQDRITNIRKDISNASDWGTLSLKDNGIDTRLKLLISGIDEINRIEEGLDLSDEIKGFLVDVSRGKAKAIDINPTIINWINEKDLQDKFVVGFKNI